MPFVNPLNLPAENNESLTYLFEIDLNTEQAANEVAVLDLEDVGARTVAGFREFRSPLPPVVPVVNLAYYASEDWTSSAADTVVPNRWYDGRITSAGTSSRTVGLSALEAPSIVSEVGAITLDNTDGALDVAPDNSQVINSGCTLKVGPTGGDLSTYTTLQTGVIGSADVSLTQAQINIKGLDRLTNAQFFEAVYTGGGGIEGPASLADTRKPYVLGDCFNITPVLIEPLTYIFQAHAGGPLAAVNEVRIGGVTMVFTADYPDYATLTAAAPAIGEYATCLALGLIKAGLTQSGATDSFALTIDCETAVTEAGDIAISIAQQIETDLGIPYDPVTFAEVALDRTGMIYGRYITEPITYGEVMNDVMRNMNAYWGSNRTGSLTTGILSPPSGAVPATSYDQNSILTISRLALPNGFEWPHKERTVQYEKNWTVQTSLAAIVNNPSLSREFKDYTESVPIRIVSALTPQPVSTNLRFRAGAQKLASILLSLHGSPRQMYGMTVPIIMGTPGLLTTTNVTYPRFDLKGGKELVVVALSENYGAGTVQVTLWG